MILLGVGISIAVVVLVGFLVSKRIAGDSANFLVAGRSLPLILVGGALMGSAVDTNATLGTLTWQPNSGSGRVPAYRSASRSACSSRAFSSPSR
jgi:Na+/proline symporter